jgi:5-methyltetrahydropteroyltriglutamate--homocysteine methyltransferase
VQRTTPPFRADHVGSLLRPAELKQARARREMGEITAEELRAVEDRAIASLIAKQAEIGLRGATDGEFRRAMWHFDFLERLDGCEPYTPESGIAFQGTATKAKGVRVVGKVGFSGHPMIEHFRFLKEYVTKAIPKMTLPSPSVLHFRGGRKAIGEAVYPDLNDFYRDLGRAYNRAVHAFAGAGCRYLQLDETNLAYLCDPEQRQAIRARGEDPDQLPAIYAQMINAAIEGRPADMTITMHLCRGNFRSSWIAQAFNYPQIGLAGL